MGNISTATLPDDAASECYALVFDSDLDAKTLINMRAVIAIGKLTHKQYLRICSEFERHYTVKKHVVVSCSNRPCSYIASLLKYQRQNCYVVYWKPNTRQTNI